MKLKYANMERLQEEEIRAKSAEVLGEIAVDRKTDTAVDALEAALYDDNTTLAAAAAEALETIIGRDPSPVLSTIPGLLDVFVSTDESELQTNCLETLTVIASTEPDEFTERIDSARALSFFNSDSPTVRAGGVGLLGFVADVDPALLSPHEDAIRRLTHDDSPIVRANAIMTLGSLSGEEARGRAERLAEAPDEAEIVREAATDALDRF